MPRTEPLEDIIEDRERLAENIKSRLRNLEAADMRDTFGHAVLMEELEEVNREILRLRDMLEDTSA